MLELAWISGDTSQRWGQDCDQLDRLPDLPAQHLLHIGDYRIEIHDFWLQDLPTTEGQELSSQGSRPLACLRDLLEALTLVLVERRIVGQKKVAVTRHDREQVIEVMSDASSELSDGFHLLSLAKLGLKLFALSDLGDECGEPIRRPDFQGTH